MKVQRVCLPDNDKVTWIVLGKDYLPIAPIGEFLNYLRNLEKSPNTVRSYAYHLKLYWQYLDESRLEWTEVDITELADFITWLRNPTDSVISLQEVESKRTESTVNVILTTVCKFYEFQEQIEKVESIPLYRLQMNSNKRYKGFLHHVTKNKPTRTRLLKLKEPQLQPKTLALEQVEQLIDACHRLRDKFLLCLLHEGGIRIGQALGLCHEDIASWDNIIKIVPRDDNANQARAKTTSPYEVNVSKELMGLYTQYLQEEFMEILEDNFSDYVFVNLWEGKIGSPMTYNNVMALFTRLKRKTGIAATPHKLRHSHATDLIREGMPMAYVQKRLGHANIPTTINTYVHVSDEDMKQSYQEYLKKRDKDNAPRI